VHIVLIVHFMLIVHIVHFVLIVHIVFKCVVVCVCVVRPCATPDHFPHLSIYICVYVYIRMVPQSACRVAAIPGAQRRHAGLSARPQNRVFAISFHLCSRDRGSDGELRVADSSSHERFCRDQHFGSCNELPHMHLLLRLVRSV